MAWKAYSWAAGGFVARLLIDNADHDPSHRSRGAGRTSCREQLSGQRLAYGKTLNDRHCNVTQHTKQQARSPAMALVAMPGCDIALAFCVSLGMSWSRLPAPSCHDEFSHLLVADTLRHARLANPAPELWQPFQSFHVLVNPSYASKFPWDPVRCSHWAGLFWELQRRGSGLGQRCVQRPSPGLRLVVCRVAGQYWPAFC